MFEGCLLASTFFCYLGQLNHEFRHKLLIDIVYHDLVERRIPATSGFNLGSFLVDETDIFAWKSEGLPADELSIQNGLLITQPSRFPLCIDPQLQVIRWI
jgi:dynein heavy chain